MKKGSIIISRWALRNSLGRQWPDILIYVWQWKWRSLSRVRFFATRIYSPWNSPGQSTGVGSLSLLQGIFLTQGSNPGLLQCRWTVYQLSHKGSLRILEWVVCPFSSWSSQPRNWTRVSCIAGRFFTSWAIRDDAFKMLGIIEVLRCARQNSKNDLQDSLNSICHMVNGMNGWVELTFLL